jgi:hypothetical protein
MTHVESGSVGLRVDYDPFLSLDVERVTEIGKNEEQRLRGEMSAWTKPAGNLAQNVWETVPDRTSFRTQTRDAPRRCLQRRLGARSTVEAQMLAGRTFGRRFGCWKRNGRC